MSTHSKSEDVRTRFAHMTIDQLKEKARDNNLRRCILRELIRESDFSRVGSKFDLLVSDYRDCAALFSKTVPQRQMRRYQIWIGQRQVTILVNLTDVFTQELWIKTQSCLVLNVQGLFGIDHNLKFSFDDQPFMRLVESLTTLTTGFVGFAFDTCRVVSMASFVLRLIRMLCTRTYDSMDVTLLFVEGLAMVSDFSRVVEVAKELVVHFQNVHAWIRNTLVSQVGDVDPIASLTTLMCMFFGTTIMKSIPKGSQIDDAVMGTMKFGNLMKGMSNSWSVIEKVANYCFGKVFEWMYGIPPHIAQLEECVTGVTQWYKDVQALVSLQTPDQIAMDSQKCAEIETLYAQGVRYSAMIGDFKFDRNIMSGFQTHFRVLQACYERAQSSGAFRGGPRIEPIVVLIHGTSGVGKSGMMYPLAIDLCKIDGIPNDDFTQLIYNRNVEQEFWDGYRGQRICIYDDFAQMRDSQANPNLEFMELIRTGNLAPYPLHMATIEEKAKTYFKSRVVLMTSNTAVFDPQSLTWPDAVRRRIDLSAEITIKPEYASYDQAAQVWRLDPQKVFDLTGVWISLDVYEVHLSDVQTGRRLPGPALSYDEFRKRCEALYRERFEKSAKLFEFLSSRVIQLPPMNVLPPPIQFGDALVAQLYMPDLQPGGQIVMRDCATALLDLDLMDFAMLCDFGYPSCYPIFNENTSLWLEDLMEMLHRGQIGPQDAYGLFLGFANSSDTGYVLGVEEIVKRMIDDNHIDPLNFLGQDVDQRYPCLLHFVQRQEIRRNPLHRQMLDTLQNSVRVSKDAMSKTFDKLKETLNQAKWYHFALAAIPLVSLAWWFYARPKTALSGPERKPHKISPMEVKDVSHLIEMNASADPKTLNVRKNVIEMSASGDPKTLNVRKNVVEHGITAISPEEHQRQKLESFERAKGFFREQGCYIPEMSASADPKTLNVRKNVVEMEEDIPMKRTIDNIRTYAGVGALAALALLPGNTHVTRGIMVGTAMGLHCARKALDAQLQLDPNAFAVSKKVLNNMYDIQLEMDNKWGPRMKLCMIKGRIGLTVAHLLPYLVQCSRVRLYNKNCPNGHVFDLKELTYQTVKDVSGEPKDQLLIGFSSKLHDHADILGSFADSVTMSSFKRCNAALCVPFEGGALMKYGEIKSCDRNEISYVDGKREYLIRDRYEYTSLETTKGDCGSILIAIGSHLPKKIIGIHVAGNVGLGVASPLSIKDIERALVGFAPEAQISLDCDLYLRAQASFDEIEKPEGNFVSMGNPTISVRGPMKTVLRKSLCHGKIVPATTAPAVLVPVERDGVVVDPMMNGLKKAGRIPPPLNEYYLDVAINDMMRILCSNVREEDARVLSNLEAVTGIEGDDCLPPVKRSSSPGYPWIKERKGIGKTKWLGSDAYTLSPDVEFVMNERVRLAKIGVRYPTFWIDTLKDERRPLDKIAAVKTRVFSAGPMDYTLTFRKYFLGFAAHCARNRIDNEISVGTNVYSHDWTRTAKRCTSKGKKVIAGDFSNFDGTLLLPILYKMLDIINAFYNDGEENNMIRHVLWKEIINSVHVCGDSVYLWTHSQPSGCPITAILNSIYNSISMRYCWMVVYEGKPQMQSMKMFNSNVAMVSYGDDNIVNISDAVCEEFNQITIAQAYATIDMIYTDELKSGDMVKYRDLSSIAYLKRKFVWDKNEMQFLAPLALETVLEMTNWIRGELDQESSTSENLETSAFELSLHGREIFDEWIGKYKIACRGFSECPKFLTFDEYRLSEAVKYGRLNGHGLM